MRRKLYVIGLGLFAVVDLFGSGMETKTVCDMETVPVPSAFTKGAREWQVIGGSYFSASDDIFGNEIDFAWLAVRHGWMLGEIGGSRWMRGNWQFLLEGFGGPVFEGPGTAVAGISFFFRRNFVRGNPRLVPYVQVGGGLALSDAANAARSQLLIGSAASFQLQASVGIRWLVSDRWSLFTEINYMHISNAGLASRNTGLNGLGAGMGIGWHFW